MQIARLSLLTPCPQPSQGLPLLLYAPAPVLPFTTLQQTLPACPHSHSFGTVRGPDSEEKIQELVVYAILGANSCEVYSRLNFEI